MGTYGGVVVAVGETTKVMVPGIGCTGQNPATYLTSRFVAVDIESVAVTVCERSAG